MKFSDMMNKRDRGEAEVADPELPPEARTAPPVPEAPIRFGSARREVDDSALGGSIAPAGTPSAPVDEPAPGEPTAPAVLAPPSVQDVVAELAPRNPAAATAATDQQLDTSAWLDGISTIDDDLLPR
jgi:hypothetical protein